MRKTYIYNANIKLLYLYFYLLRSRKIKRVKKFNILLFTRINILQFIIISYI